MQSVIAKSGNLSCYLKTSSQVVASGLKPLATPSPTEKKLVTFTPPEGSSKGCLKSSLPIGKLRISSGPGVSTQVRFAHTDIAVPDFSAYRRDSVKSPSSKNSDSADARKSFTYLMVGGSSVVTAYGAKSVVTHFISSMSASADVLALAKIEVKLGDIPEGKNVTFKWRGKPLFIRHRTGNEISTEQSVPVGTLRDPQHDNERVQKPQWLVLIGVCTHLGCVPIANAGDFGGYYCPCHGSHYDASGRIRKGPAPLNLEVPTYIFPDENTLLVG